MMTRFKFLRISYGIKQEEIAKKIGCTKQLISLMETGKLKGSIKTQKAIAKVMKVKRESLFD